MPVGQRGIKADEVYWQWLARQVDRLLIPDLHCSRISTLNLDHRRGK